MVGFNEHGNVLHFIRDEGFLSHCHLFKKKPCPVELLGSHGLNVMLD